ncbi:hypothetical protein BJ165DRAFT_1523991 [Panaeolus papilionaceus]|nr:hypothetical protein BJ165DRAFT_1523991 [Panaeolus papilionaceus]
MAGQVSGGGASTKLLITGGSHTFQLLNDTPASAGHPGAFERLFNHICERAFHNSDKFDEIKCHPGTRTSILKVLSDFANDTEYPFVTWLNGPAGAGKTAVGRSLAELCEEAGILAACFFFWRSDLERSDEKRLIATLAYQLCLSIPRLRPFVERKVADDPAIFSKPLKLQLWTLILAPLRQMRESHSTFAVQTSARLIIIDGLDECGGQSSDRINRQERALDALGQLASNQNIFPFRILIISRTEAHLRRRFEGPRLQNLTRPLPLDYSFTPDKDILVYVTHEFLWIVNHHPYGRYLPSGWPGNHIINAIVIKSSGQFIYAATVMRFIRSELHRPDKRLLLIQDLTEHQVIRGEVSHFVPVDNPSVALKLLAFHFAHRHPMHLSLVSSAMHYEQIPTLPSLSHSSYRDPTVMWPWYPPPEQRPPEFLPLTSIEKYLKLDSGAIIHSLSHFESLFTVLPEFSIEGGFIQVHHASFVDFLFDKARSQEWHLDSNCESGTSVTGLLSEIEDTTAGAVFFCIGQYARAQWSLTPIIMSELDIRKCWFLLICEAVKCSPRATCVDSVISTKWLRPSQYNPGLNFFESCGVQAFHYLQVFVDAASEYYSKTFEAKEVDEFRGAMSTSCRQGDGTISDRMEQDFLTDLLPLIQTKIQAYRSDPFLFALLIYSARYHPYRPSRLLAISNSYLISNSWVWLREHIKSRPSLIDIDSKKFRFTSHDDDDSAGWLYCCLEKLVAHMAHILPDDDLLRESTTIIFKILLRRVSDKGLIRADTQASAGWDHREGNINVIQNFISALLKPLSPSAEVADLVERLQTALLEAYTSDIKQDPIIQQYLASCSQLSQSGLPLDLSFIDQEDRNRDFDVSLEFSPLEL